VFHILLYKLKLIPFLIPGRGSKGAGKGEALSGLTMGESKELIAKDPLLSL